MTRHKLGLIGLGKIAHDQHLPAIKANPAFDLVAVYQDLLARDDLAGLEVHDRFFEIGSHAGLEETHAHLAGKSPSADHT